MQATTQYFVLRFFYRQLLDFHRPSKILCQTSGRQNHWSLKQILNLKCQKPCIQNPDPQDKGGRSEFFFTVR
jgi:hypothetical protein